MAKDGGNIARGRRWRCAMALAQRRQQHRKGTPVAMCDGVGTARIAARRETDKATEKGRSKEVRVPGNGHRSSHWLHPGRANAIDHRPSSLTCDVAAVFCHRHRRCPAMLPPSFTLDPAALVRLPVRRNLHNSRSVPLSRGRGLRCGSHNGCSVVPVRGSHIRSCRTYAFLHA
jgi:hypothetical protein